MKTSQDKPLYQLLASVIGARLRCMEASANESQREWKDKHEEFIDRACKALMPSGAGWDNGTTMDFEASTEDKLVFYGSYHHMDDGYYAGWTDHRITVRASMVHEITLTISGRDRNRIKDYLHDIFHHALTSTVSRKKQCKLSGAPDDSERFAITE